MSDNFVIDTGKDVFKEPKTEAYGFLPEHHEMLRRPIPNLELVLPNTQVDILIQRLHKTMQKAGGIGLSANQCGVNMRMFIMGFGEQVYACINPEVIEQSDELVDDQEGCLSFPGLILRVRRPRWIQAKYTNKNGETVEERFEGLTARCYLHELDHMNGVVFTEKVGPVSLQKGRRKQQKLIKALTRKMKNEKRSNH